MTRNPYADPPGFEPEPPPQRVSALAVTSLIFGILCCIPGVGFIALILGGAAMVAIGRSQGRLSGRGLATAGLVLGLLGVIWTGLVGFGLLQFQSQIQSLSGTYAFLDQRDYPGFRSMLAPAASQQLSDEELAEFQAKVNAEYGKLLGATRGIGEVFSEYMKVGPDIQRMQQRYNLTRNVIPVPLRFEQGTALAMIQVDPNQGTGRGTPGILNIVIVDKQGNAIWLIPPGQGTPVPPTPGAVPPPVSPGEAPAPPAEAPGEPVTPPEEPGPG